MKMFDVYSVYDVELVKGQGAYVFDKAGNKYLDFYGGHAVISIGHTHPHYVSRLTGQIEKLVFYSNSVVNTLQDQLAEKLAKVSGIEGYDLFLVNSGAEANENALKLASFGNGKSKIIALKNGFHGRTSAAVNATDNKKIQAALNKGFEVEYHGIDDVYSIVASIQKNNACAVILEAIQGIGGMDCITAEALAKISATCKEHNTALILDEVQAGYGRSGSFFAYEIADIKPDIISMAKGMGNGFPIGGLLINSESYKAKKSMLGTTFGGNHLACVAGLAVLEVIEKENLIHNSKHLGEQLANSIKDIPEVKQLKGRGLMIGAEFDFPIKELRKHLVLNHSLFTGSSKNPNMLRLLPPLNINPSHADEFIEKLKAGIKSYTNKTVATA